MIKTPRKTFENETSEVMNEPQALERAKTLKPGEKVRQVGTDMYVVVIDQ
jgi:hypothetical protein